MSPTKASLLDLNACLIIHKASWTHYKFLKQSLEFSIVLKRVTQIHCRFCSRVVKYIRDWQKIGKKTIFICRSKNPSWNWNMKVFRGNCIDDTRRSYAQQGWLNLNKTIIPCKLLCDMTTVSKVGVTSRHVLLALSVSFKMNLCTTQKPPQNRDCLHTTFKWRWFTFTRAILRTHASFFLCVR